MWPKNTHAINFHDWKPENLEMPGSLLINHILRCEVLLSEHSTFSNLLPSSSRKLNVQHKYQ